MSVCRNQVDYDMVRVSQCSAGNGMMGSVDCNVTVIQNVVPYGWRFNKLVSLFGEFMAEITFVKVTKDNKQF